MARVRFAANSVFYFLQGVYELIRLDSVRVEHLYSMEVIIGVHAASLDRTDCVVELGECGAEAYCIVSASLSAARLLGS